MYCCHSTALADYVHKSLVNTKPSSTRTFIFASAVTFYTESITEQRWHGMPLAECNISSTKIHFESLTVPFNSFILGAYIYYESLSL